MFVCLFVLETYSLARSVFEKTPPNKNSSSTTAGSPENMLTAFLLHAEHIHIDVRILNFTGNGILRKVISQRFTQAIETGSEFR